MIATPALTILTALAGAKLILSETIPDNAAETVACTAIGVVALILSMFGAYRAGRKKFVAGMLFAAGYAAALMLSDLMFFGEGYGAILPNMISVLTGGVIGSLIGGGRRRNKRHA